MTVWTKRGAMALAFVVAACGGKDDGRGKGGGHDDHADDDHGEVDDEHDDHGPIVLSEKAALLAKIETAAAEVRTMSAELETTGQVGFDETRLAHVSPRISGRVHSVKVELGKDVKKGETLAVIDSVELGRAKADFLKAKVRHEVAKTTFEREEGLAAKKISSEKDMLDAQAVYRSARVELDTSRQILRLYGMSDGSIDRIAYDKSGTALLWLPSPLAGRIVEKHATVGELVTPEVKIFTVADLSHVWIWIDVYERDLSRVHVDDVATIYVDAFRDRVFAGKVSLIGAQVDEHTRTVRARVDVPNADDALRPGMFARVQLDDPHAAPGEGSATTITVIPAVAVQRDGDEQISFVETGERSYERRVLTLGRRLGDFVEVIEGVADGERVAITGTFLLKSEAGKEAMGGGHGH